ncbi:sigma factor-like helix-turn-helix DNA-binding protein [Sphingobium sp. Sx8-8]|uniref:sigma factor-like helix-turn-helix DNA-binding protein n=1 Tax=Sphingobium sp. Sx8-8 TaxID=2933617 RepID=UPI001F5A3674|nr:sigma factor-like helix-turn-helix DNA-binding protein [Sphingobium sp. Sx8-8]
MADAPDPEVERLAAYRKAVDRLPVLTRVIFLLVRLDALSYDEIARRLSIDAQAVESCLVEALGMIRIMLDGELPRRRDDPRIALAEADLHRRHRAYCEEALWALGIAGPIPWPGDSDDDQTLMRMIVAAMPPRVHATFILHGVDRLSYARIAERMGTFQWIVRYRMLRAIRHIARAPDQFEQWLRDRASAPATIN